MTYKEMQEEVKKGNYIECGWAWQRKYVSRTIDVDQQKVSNPVRTGRRFGQVFVEIPSWESTYYSYRYYFRKVEN